MDSLRLILLAIGLVILALIWLFHRPGGSARGAGASPREERRREPGFDSGRARPARKPKDGASDEPEFSPEPEQARLAEFDSHEAGTQAAGPPPDESRGKPDAPDARPETKAGPGSTAATGRPSPSGDGVLIVTLYVRARDDRRISGLSLLDAAIKAGLRFGEMKIFHRRHRGEPQPVFSMANITRPGYFDPSGWNLFETPGVSLFMRLPGPVSALDGWDAMLATGRRLAELLDADLLDDAQCLLTRQRTAQIREQMREFDRKSGLMQGS